MNTATITDATKVPETPSTVPAPTTSVTSIVTLDTTRANPVAATAPGAQISTTSGAPAVQTQDIAGDVVRIMFDRMCVCIDSVRSNLYRMRSSRRRISLCPSRAIILRMS